MYELLDKIGTGAFGEVYRARHVDSREVVAVKRLRLQDDGRLQCLPAPLFQEIEALRQLTHPNIVQLKDVYPDGTYLSLVFELVETDLFSVLRHTRDPLAEADVRGLLRMLLQGVAHCHANSILHRDIKPGNLLITSQGMLKIADFGLANVFVGASATYSHQIATRWYRAPELLFGSRSYDAGVDMWGVGTVLAEMLRPVPLFPGQNDLDQLYRIIQVLGSPEPQWPDVVKLPDFCKVSFPSYQPIPLRQLFPNVSAQAVDLLSQLLVLDPKRRISARQALAHPYFVSGPLHFVFSLPAQEKSNNNSEDQELLQHTRKDDLHSSSDDFLASLGKPLWTPYAQ